MGAWDWISKTASDVGKTASNNSELIKGVGTLASAWGAYETGKDANELLKKQLALSEASYNRGVAKEDLAQSNLDSAIESSFGSTKKKKKDDTTTTDVSDAFSTTA